MDITEHTKISEIIKANKESVDAIASVAKPLERLKNPILRKVMASRVSLGEAARMGGSTVEAIAEALKPLGYHLVGTEQKSEKVEDRPDWLIHAPEADITLFDVRPIIEHGSDPLKEILHQFKETAPGKILCIINSFVPTPLIHLLEKEKADGSFVETISDNEFHTYFLKKKKESTSAPAATANDKVLMDSEETFASVLERFGSGGFKEIDVRALEMPGPMEAILGELEVLPADNALYINHKRVPVYLLEELADKNYEVHIHHIEEGNVKMLIFLKGN
jgi:uncharacterized protein (DUF2249 family)